MSQDNSHWHKELRQAYPYVLEESSVSSERKHIVPYKAVACFPWNLDSINTLWHGCMTEDRDKVEYWRQTISKWSGVIAAGGGRSLRVFITRPHRQHQSLLRINLPDERADISCITWSLAADSDGFYPMVVFSGNRLIYIFDVERGTYHGILRGHGGKINALAVHPVDPCYLISASDDYSCRIYDLTRKADGEVVNPCWPGTTKMALAGPPFGLRSTDSEGQGYGRCVAVLAGGPSGGHLAPVQCAAFHPFYPIIATCGFDHAVKLWRVPDLFGEMIAREDKPLFSSTHVHSAPVLSITWVSTDMLISTSDKIIIRETNSCALEYRPGTLVLWRWLSLDRFFPPGRQPWPSHLQGIAADFQESSSYKVIAKYKLPLPVGAMIPSIYQSETQSPLIALPSRNFLRLASVEHFHPVRPPPFPFDDQQAEEHDHGPYINNDFEGDLVSILPCADMEIKQMANGEKHKFSDPIDMTACAFGEDGRLLIGVSKNQGLWIWRLHSEEDSQSERTTRP